MRRSTRSMTGHEEDARNISSPSTLTTGEECEQERKERERSAGEWRRSARRVRRVQESEEECKEWRRSARK